MTETKDTTQTMRDTLREHGLPVAWAEWVREIAIDVERPERCRYTVQRPEPPERAYTSYDEDGEPFDAEHTDDEMAELWAQYREDVGKWRKLHGNAEAADEWVESGLPTTYTVKLTGSGASLTLTAASDRGPWRAVEWTARPSGRGLSMIESLVVEWFDAEGWMKSVQPGAACNLDETAKNPKLSADDITAALWDMPGKERAVVLYPFWPAISEAAQRTLLAEERATAAMADAAHYRCLLNDCRRVLTTAEDDRDAARKERDEALASLDLERATSARLWKRIELDPDGRGLELPAGLRWKTDHHGGWEILDRADKEIGSVIHRAADCYTWHGEGSDHGQAPGALPACLALAASLRAVFWGWGESHEPPERAGRGK